MDSEKIKELHEIINQKNEKIRQLTLSLEDEKLKFKNELQAAHDYYENIIALMPGHVYWLDKNNVFLGCNDLQAKSAHLQSRKEIVGKTNYDMPWKDQAEILNKLNKLVMETGIPHTAEEYAVKAEGMGIYHSQKVPLRNQRDEIIGVLGISLDITEHKKMEAALRRAKENAEVANQAKTEFIENMSHDIHTPLSGIVGMSRLLEEKAEDPERKQYARWIHESGEQLLDLLNGVMEIVAADNLRENDVHEELFELRKNIKDIAYLVQPTLEMKKIKLNIEIDDTAPNSFITDGTKLHRVLLNLVGNAIRFTDKGIVTIKVETLSHENSYAQLRFSVIDTGIGIPPELKGKIFDRFFRATPSYKRQHGGYGVGLHVAQKYLSLLGGEINLESEVGKGSTFYFTLTMKIGYNENHTLAYNETNAVKKETGSHAPLILLVEDNIISLHMIENVVEQAGYQFYSAIDGEHALELLETNDFDLIITDIGIAGISDKNLVQCVRDMEKQAQKTPVPIIGLTTNTSAAKNNSMRSEMNKILTKPIHLKMLQEVVDGLNLVPSKKEK
ncbi:ATP-binding protein [Fluoribacter gormanii]|uniref:histidine kinase n=1 Tax=Fluoribacter gormanii TaxID=464 RepID=A0A377GM43_9GAMM|nr:ATP-binding protein [Fluoribacter gormanii]KTD01837.1 sensory box sensor histidine kinase/response regulator [Fluoribacter gormanii]MCW8443006.1 ATP-binding protein [Fluoribacter gormanii]SIR22572.1 PAS fold-containing protein [Fluoribacter gormanii]STO25392.1 Aerobic respiration control sensor protein ArcB [Fluoribacter gormanii]